LLVLFFEAEDGDDIFLRNVGDKQSKQTVFYLPHADFLLVLFFEAENGDMFLRNVDYKQSK
jgi:hypothetical protein